MKKPGNIVESVNFVSEEDLLVQELDKRLSFDMLPVGAEAASRNCVHCDSVCGCLVVTCPNKGTPATCGVRG